MRKPRIAVVIAVALAITLGVVPAMAQQTCVPFPSIIAGSIPEYATYQIKFTYIGEQARSKASLGIAGTGTAFAIPAFSPCLLPAGRYGNDAAPPYVIALSPAEFDRFIGKLAARPEFQTTTVPSNGVLAWQIRRPAGPGSLVFEHVSTRTGAKTVLVLLLDSLDPGRLLEEDIIIRAKRIYVGTL